MTDKHIETEFALHDGIERLRLRSPAPVGEQAVGDEGSRERELRQQLAAVRAMSSRADVEIERLDQQLTAARAEIERLKSVLKTIANNGHKSHWSKTRIVNLASNETFDWQLQPDLRDAHIDTLAKALREHHQWQLTRGEVNLETEEGKPPILIDNGAEYCDSAMYKHTVMALAAVEKRGE